jgi:molybdopterin molybdotransferase
MISIGEAKNILRERLQPLKPERCALREAGGKILAAEIRAPVDVPSFDNAAMDGYALRFDPQCRVYRVCGHIAAGDQTPTNPVSGEAVRIFTGAAVPSGADTVIQQELAIRDGDQVQFSGALKAGMNIRLRGTQCRRGDIVASRGDRVTPGLTALLSSVGLTHVEVFRLPRVAVIVTGDEIVAPGSVLPPGAVYNTNGPFLQHYVESLGFPIASCSQVKDDKTLLHQAVCDALTQSDVLILTGGISVGEHDYVQEILLSQGVEPLFYKVRQKPGKPLFAGVSAAGPVFALPGNPASVIACFNQYVKPVLLGMAGHSRVFEPDAVLPLGNNYSKKAGLGHILKARVLHGQVEIMGGQESFNLLPFSQANAFVLLDEDLETIDAGQSVDVYCW